MTLDEHRRTLDRRPDRRVLALVATAACSKQAAEEVESETVVPVTTAPATLGAIRGVVHATGVVDPGAGRRARGRRARGGAHRGDSARRGRPRAAGRRARPLRDSELRGGGAAQQARRSQRAQAALANAKANQTRAHELFDRGVAARKEVEDADRAVADAEAALAQAEARASRRRQHRRRRARSCARPSTASSRSATTTPAISSKPAPATRCCASSIRGGSKSSRRCRSPTRSRIVIGAPAHLASVAAGDPEVGLKVVSRPAAVDAGTATIPVRLAFDAPTNLPVGTPVQVDIDAEQHTNVVLIPAPALVREGEETAVFVVNGDKAQRRPGARSA